MSFLLKNSFSLENLGASFSFIASRKKKPTSVYNKTAPIVVDVKTNVIPHHLPKTKPANINNGPTKPKNRTQTTEKIKNTNAKIYVKPFRHFKNIRK